MAASSHAEIERQIQEIRSKQKKTVTNVSSGKVGLLWTGGYDTGIYTSSDTHTYAGYFTSIAPNEEEEGDNGDVGVDPTRSTFFTPSNFLLNDVLLNNQAEDPFAGSRPKRILERYNEYHMRHQRNFIISPPRRDPFATDDAEPPTPMRGLLLMS